MKFSIRAMILVLSAILAAPIHAETAPVMVLQDITKSNYDDFLDQFTESCQGHAQTFMMQVSLVANLFNRGKYDDAAMMLERRVHGPNGSVLSLMNSDDCTLEDLRTLMAQTEALVPLKENVYCLLRIGDAEYDFNKAGEYLNNEDIAASYATMGQATFALKEIEETQMCQHMPEDIKAKITEMVRSYTEIEQQLKQILEM